MTDAHKALKMHAAAWMSRDQSSEFRKKQWPFETLPLRFPEPCPLNPGNGLAVQFLAI
jgi:hypothetical protein